MVLRSPTENENGVCPPTLNFPTSPSFPDAFSSGSTRLTTGESGTGPRLKHSGVTVFGIASLDPSQIFEGADVIRSRLIRPLSVRIYKPGQSRRLPYYP